MINRSEYINFSGGAFGADQTWDKQGRLYGFNNHINFQQNDYHEAAHWVKNEIDIAVANAAAALCRPEYFTGMDLVRRNWFQVAGGEEIFAISRIIKPGDFDGQFKNKSGKQVVSGGTGWAVEMAIQMEKQVYVFDVNVNLWFKWYEDKFEHCPRTFVPQLTKHYAGIGTRYITQGGIEAIRQCYGLLNSL